jgi:hypothetical protein
MMDYLFTIAITLSCAARQDLILQLDFSDAERTLSITTPATSTSFNQNLQTFQEENE